MITYRVIGKKSDSGICKGIISYGIFALGNDYSKVAEISDISADREAVIKLAEAMNRNCLSLVHFQDVVEDFLATEY